jgi:hypothetical protein
MIKSETLDKKKEFRDYINRKNIENSKIKIAEKSKEKK